jgi:F0F1-type ATP synthase assembly protein I
MKKNVGKIDKVIRIILAIALFVAAFAIPLTGAWLYLFIAFGIIFLVTSIVSFCPLYTLCGCNTCPMKTEGEKK